MKGCKPRIDWWAVALAVAGALTLWVMLHP